MDEKQQRDNNSSISLFCHSSLLLISLLIPFPSFCYLHNFFPFSFPLPGSSNLFHLSFTQSPSLLCLLPHSSPSMPSSPLLLSPHMPPHPSFSNPETHSPQHSSLPISLFLTSPVNLVFSLLIFSTLPPSYLPSHISHVFHFN